MENRNNEENDPLAKILKEIIMQEMVSEFLGREASENETYSLIAMANKSKYN